MLPPTQRMLEHGSIHFDPLTILMGASLAFSGFGAVSSVISGHRSAQREEQNAVIAQQRAQSEAKKHREDTLRRMGTTRAAFGASGADLTGTVDDVAADDLLTANRENSMILWGGLGQASDHNSRASAARQQGWSSAISQVGQGLGTYLTASYSYDQGLKAGAAKPLKTGS